MTKEKRLAQLELAKRSRYKLSWKIIYISIIARNEVKTQIKTPDKLMSSVHVGILPWISAN